MDQNMSPLRPKILPKVVEKLKSPIDQKIFFYNIGNLLGIMCTNFEARETSLEL